MNPCTNWCEVFELWTFDMIPFKIEPWLWTLCYDSFEPLIWYIWYDTFDMIHLIWYIDMDLWIWDIWAFDIWHYLDPPVWYYEPICYTSHGGSMSMSLMHRWHDSRVGEWWPIPSHYLICHGDEVIWPLGAYGCILDLIWFVSMDMTLYDLIFIWWLMVCAIHVFHNIWELATPPLWGHPS